jgi:hypothetical protein
VENHGAVAAAGEREADPILRRGGLLIEEFFSRSRAVLVFHHSAKRPTVVRFTFSLLSSMFFGVSTRRYVSSNCRFSKIRRLNVAIG